jgi:carbamoyl-phosphate synthase large subunit
MEGYTILVTGCGGDIGQSIGKILKTYDRAKSVIGCDIHNEHAGHFIFDECFLIERADSPSYLNSLSLLVESEGVDIIIPATEHELEFLLVNDHKRIENLLIIRPDDLSLEIGLDKLKTAEFLEKNRLPFPKTDVLGRIADPSFPCIIKARKGSGSKSLHIVKDRETFSLLTKLLKDSICQEYIATVNDEFTCALFRSQAGIVRSLIFRRKLTGGYSSFGIVEKNASIEALLERLAICLDLVGSINIQLRMRDGVPMIFEINSRFSSTVLFRHLLGFEDVIWAIEDKLNLPLKPYSEPLEGSKFYKGFQEYIVKS